MTIEEKKELIKKIPNLSTNHLMELLIKVNMLKGISKCTLIEQSKNILNEELSQRIKKNNNVLD